MIFINGNIYINEKEHQWKVTFNHMNHIVEWDMPKMDKNYIISVVKISQNWQDWTAALRNAHMSGKMERKKIM